MSDEPDVDESKEIEDLEGIEQDIYPQDEDDIEDDDDMDEDEVDETS